MLKQKINKVRAEIEVLDISQAEKDALEVGVLIGLQLMNDYVGEMLEAMKDSRNGAKKEGEG